MLSDRLAELGAAYGDFPAHDGLWQAAYDTRQDLLARLAVVPMVLEARGLDVTPTMMAKFKAAGDDKSAAMLNIIYEDEKPMSPLAQNGFCICVIYASSTRKTVWRKSAGQFSRQVKTAL